MMRKITNLMLASLLLMSIILPMLAKPVVFAQPSATNSTVLTFTVPGKVSNISASSIKSFIYNTTVEVMEIAWGIALLTFAVGWALRGSPIPYYDWKQHGHQFIYDAMLAAVFLALGSTIFYIIETVVLHL